MNTKSTIPSLIIAIGIPLLVGSFSSFLSGNVTNDYQMLILPPLSPPGFIFPIVWTILFICMGIASYLVYTSMDNPSIKNPALILYGIQLIVNFFWSIIFFTKEWYLFAFIWLIFLWILIILTIREFYKISKPAAYLMVPYLLWVTFAGYLNLMIYLYNSVFI